MESFEEKLKRVTSEKISLVPYDAAWPGLFEQEKNHLLSLFGDIIEQIEHFGSTAIGGVCAKPIIDMLIEVSSLDEAKEKMVPALEAQGYDYFWRPPFGNGDGGDSRPAADSKPVAGFKPASTDDPQKRWYCWFIKRGSAGKRTHHLHVVDASIFRARTLETCGFRDYLNAHPDVKKEYETLKLALAKEHEENRIEYTLQKSEFIESVVKKIHER